MKVLREAVRFVASFVLLGAVAALANLPIRIDPQNGILRLDLRSTVGRLEVCRDHTAEELDALPAHMRRTQVCEELALSYRLEVEVDGERRLSTVVEPEGLRRSRPLVFAHQLEIDPGRHGLVVRFLPQPPVSLTAGFEEAVAGTPRFELAEQVDLEAGKIVLVTLEDRLVLHR